MSGCLPGVSESTQSVAVLLMAAWAAPGFAPGLGILREGTGNSRDACCGTGPTSRQQCDCFMRVSGAVSVCTSVGLLQWRQPCQPPPSLALHQRVLATPAVLLCMTLLSVGFLFCEAPVECHGAVPIPGVSLKVSVLFTGFSSLMACLLCTELCGVCTNRS